jgi:PKD repeat protein
MLVILLLGSSFTILLSLKPVKADLSAADITADLLTRAVSKNNGDNGGPVNPSWASVDGNEPLYYIPVTLANDRSTATPTNFQQHITIDSDANTAFYASNLDNVNWQDGAGNILNSWLESGTNVTATASVYWVNLGSRTIAPSGGTLTIYEVIYAKTVDCMNTANTGAEPLYTATYGQYDDGAAVFSTYDNFAGASLSSQWTVPPGSGYSVDDGFVANPSGWCTTAVYDSSVQESSSLINEWYIAPFTINNHNCSDWQLNRYTAYSDMHRLGTAGSDCLVYLLGARHILENVSVADSSGNNVFGLWNGGSSITWFFDYTPCCSVSQPGAWQPIREDYLSLSWAAPVVPAFPTLYWVRTRLYPPNGVMPTPQVACRVPVAKFTWSPLQPIADESVTFDASSSLPGWNGTNTIPITLYSWDFGDGIKTTGQTAIHTYTSPGNYHVTLNVTDSQGLWNVKQQQIKVILGGLHVQPNVSGTGATNATYTYAPSLEFCVYIDVVNATQLFAYQAGFAFNATVLQVLNVTIGDFLLKPGMTDEGLSIYGEINNTAGTVTASAFCLLNPQDNQTGSGHLFKVWFGINPTFRPSYSGTHQSCQALMMHFNNTVQSTLGLILCDTNGDDITTSYSDITDGYCTLIAPSRAYFEVSPGPPYCMGEKILFNATTCNGWNGTYATPITAYSWNFGDGNKTVTVNPLIAHAYVSAGNFTVTLVAQDSQGLNSTFSSTIMVVMPTSTSISNSKSTSFIGFAVDINGTLLAAFALFLALVLVLVWFVYVVSRVIVRKGHDERPRHI